MAWTTFYVEENWGQWPARTFTIFYFRDSAWNAYPPDVQWRIVDSEDVGIEGITVNIGGVDYVTDENGEIEIDDLAEGSYTIQLSKSGYPTPNWTEYLHTTAAIDIREIRYPSWGELETPSESDVKIGVSYAEGTKTGRFTGEMPQLSLEIPQTSFAPETPQTSIELEIPQTTLALEFPQTTLALEIPETTLTLEM